MAALWTWFCGLFTKKTVGILTKILFTSTTSVLLKDLMDKDVQKAAYDFVKELNNRTDMTNTEKAWVFNQKMYEWMKKEGKKIGESVINCLREMAVNALKMEKGRQLKQ